MKRRLLSIVVLGVAAWLAVVNARDPVCREMRDEWF